jgi:hypothetical protein
LFRYSSKEENILALTLLMHNRSSLAATIAFLKDLYSFVLGSIFCDYSTRNWRWVSINACLASVSCVERSNGYFNVAIFFVAPLVN